MPAGVPVATFAIGEAGATNAALFAVALLAADDDELPHALDDYRRTRHDAAAASSCHRRDPITPPATIGMLGGGQLGRYALLAARAMGTERWCSTRSPARRPAPWPTSTSSPPTTTRPRSTASAWTCAVVTTEFENPPAATLERHWPRTTMVAPNPEAVAIAQDRRREKRFLADDGVAVGPFHVIDTEPTSMTLEGRGFPAILKTARLGYDGKGQRTVADRTGLLGAWRRLGACPCVLEQRLHLDAELSVVVARSGRR